MSDNKKFKILLVEDDINLGSILKEFLIIKNYETTLAKDGREGKDLFEKNDFDLCLLDVMMPKLDGFNLAKIIKSKNKNIPIIFLTAKSMLQDKILGFEIGADDYITKPFSSEELFLRINAVLKRTKSIKKKTYSVSQVFNLGKYKFDYRNRILSHGRDNFSLTSKEAELLKLFCQHVNEILTRSEALQIIWSEDNYFNSRSMDVYVTKLRKYLIHDDSISIVNVHGKGFKLIVGK